MEHEAFRRENFTSWEICGMFDELELEFEWDTEKEQDNIREHGINFEAAERIFFDYFRMERHDDDSSDNEDRWQRHWVCLTMCFLWFIRNVETLSV